MTTEDVTRSEWYGFYPGIVMANDDTGHPPFSRTGRLRIWVPQFHGGRSQNDVPINKLPWAYPAGYSVSTGTVTTNAGDEVKYGHVDIPPVNSTVWVTFEDGDPDNPLWLSRWGNSGDMPDEAVLDEEVGVVYPDIWLWKFPHKKNAFMRMSGDRKLEIQFDTDLRLVWNQNLKKFTLDVDADEWELELNVKKKVTINTEKLDIFTTDDIRMYSDGTITIWGKKKVTLASGEKDSTEGIVEARSPTSQGFEQHHPAQDNTGNVAVSGSSFAPPD